MKYKYEKRKMTEQIKFFYVKIYDETLTTRKKSYISSWTCDNVVLSLQNYKQNAFSGQNTNVVLNSDLDYSG